MDAGIDKKMLEGARKQFCLDIGMAYEAYVKNSTQKTYICKSYSTGGSNYAVQEGARGYVQRSAFFNAFICFGQLFLLVDEQIYDWAVENFGDCEPEWFCRYGNLRKIDEKLQCYGWELGDTHVYFLPREESDCRQKGHQAPVGGEAAEFSYAWYEQEEILCFKENNCFGHAIGFAPTHPDVLAVAAMLPDAKPKDFDQTHMAGMAGISADGKFLWQIGINVLNKYQGKGLASVLVRKLKEEIIRRGRIPFYGTSESHTVSQTVALKAGFVPAWTEVYATSKKD